MPFIKSASTILESGGNVIASDLTVDGTTVTVDETNNRLGVNTNTPQGTIGVDGDLYLQPTAISTSHIVGTGSIDMRADANIKIGTETADSVKIGRVNTNAVKVSIRSGDDNSLVVSNSMVGIGTDSPDHTLSVAGDIDLSGGLSFDGGTAVDSIDTDISSVAGTDTTLASAKAIKTYVDSVAGGSTDLTSDVTGTLPIANGGTNATSAADARTSLGLAIGSNVQAHDADLDTLSGCQSGGAAALAALTSTEIAILDGATLSTTELNYVDGVTSAIQTQIDSKGPVAGSSSIVTVGALNAGSITSGFTSIDVGSGAISTTGAVGTGPITTALSSATGILIDQDYTDTDAATIVGLDIDFDKSGNSTTDNNMYGIRVDMDNSSATNGSNLMVGGSFTPTCVHAADAGSVTVKGVEIVATGGTPGTEIARALDIVATGADFNQGIYSKVADGGPDLKMVSSADVGDYATIAVGANGATTFTTVDDDGANADLSFSVDGSFDVTAATSVSFAADVTISGTTPQLTIGDGGAEDTLLTWDGNTVDFRAGIDDGTDTLEIGKGTAHGTDAVIKIDSGANLVTMLNSSPDDTKYSGTVVVFQAGEDLEIGEVVYLKPADGKVYKAVASAEATSRAIAMCTVDVSANGYAAFLIEGFLRADTNFPTYTTAGVLYTPEAETSGKNVPEQTAPDSAGDFVQVIGWARDANTCYVKFDTTVVGL